MCRGSAGGKAGQWVIWSSVDLQQQGQATQHTAVVLGCAEGSESWREGTDAGRRRTGVTAKRPGGGRGVWGDSRRARCCRERV